MVEIKDDEVNVDELMLRIRQESARRQAEIASSSDSGAEQEAAASAPSNIARAPRHKMFSTDSPLQARGGDHYALDELLKYYDREFIENAYRAVLKREPDPSGLVHYLELLRGGRFDRVDILARLRSSIEGREKNVNIEGLFWPAQSRRLYRLPLIGYFIEWLVELSRLPRVIRNQRRFEAYSQIREERVVAQVNQIIEETHDYFQKLVEDINRLAGIQEQRSLALSERIERRAQALSEQVQRQALELETRTHALDEKLEAGAQALGEQLKSEAEQLRTEAAAQAVAQAAQFKTEAEQLRTDAERLREQAGQLAQRLQSTRTELMSQERRSLLLLEEARRLSLGSVEQQQYPQAMAEEEQHFLDAFYTSFEEHFRGSREEIMKRLEVYLPVLNRASITTDILDIGCGRGEWLEVLKNAGLEGRGIDTNRVQVEWCQGRGLEVANDDAITYLRSLPDASLSAVTGFHIIEHLEFESLLALLYEIIRVLKPGGLIIFETPNPENVSVANHNFYVDPTHRHPLPIPMMRFLFESRGLDRIEIIKLHPSETPRVEGQADLVQRFNEYFYGPMDYAIIGRKV